MARDYAPGSIPANLAQEHETETAAKIKISIRNLAALPVRPAGDSTILLGPVRSHPILSRLDQIVDRVPNMLALGPIASAGPEDVPDGYTT